MKALHIFFTFFIYSLKTVAMDHSDFQSFESRLNARRRNDAPFPADALRQKLTDIILVKNINLSKKILDQQHFPINTVAFKPDGRVFATGYTNLTDPILKVWSAPDNESIIAYKNDEEVFTQCMTFGCNGSILLCGSGKRLRFWDTNSWKLTRDVVFDGLSDATEINTLASSKSGKRIIMGGLPGNNNLVILTQNPTSFRVLLGHPQGLISCVGFSPDAMRAVSVCENECKVWDVVQGRVIYKFCGGSWSNCKIEYGKSNEWFLAGYDEGDGIAGHWFSYNLNTKEKTSIQLLGKILPKIKAYDRSPCGNYIFLGDEDAGNIHLFNLLTGKYLTTIAVGDGKISMISSSPDGKCMLVVVQGAGQHSLWVCNVIDDEDQKALRTIYNMEEEQLKFVEQLLSQVDPAPALNENADHIMFDKLPAPFKHLLQKFVVTEESLLDHDFFLVDDEWNILG